jgi:drug/metabolite transporter (DMT)-like permease
MKLDSSSGSVRTYMLLGLLAIIWGSSFILMKIGLVVLGATQLAMLRMACAGTALLPVVMRGWRLLKKDDVGWLLLAGLGGSVVPAWLFADAQREIPSAMAGMLNTLSPLFTLIIAVFLFNTRASWRQVVGLLIGFAGAFGLMTLRDIGGEVQFWAASKIVLATLLYGLSINVIKNKLGHQQPVWIAGFSLFAAGVIGWVFTLALGTVPDLMAHSHTAEAVKAGAAVVVLGLVGTGWALVLFYTIIARSSAIFASSVTYIIPLVAIAWGHLDGEEIGVEKIAYGLVILSGVRMIAKTENPA